MALPDVPSDPAAPLEAKVVREGHTSTVYDVKLTLAVTGDATLGPLTVPAELRIVEISGDRNPKEIWFYSVSPNRPVELPGERLLLLSADLSPGLWAGPGRYELSDEAGVSIGGTDGISSGAYVQLYAPGDAASFERFDLFVEPCELVVAEDDLAGAMNCPALADADGDQVALSWTWVRT